MWCYDEGVLTGEVVRERPVVVLAEARHSCLPKKLSRLQDCQYNPEKGFLPRQVYGKLTWDSTNLASGIGIDRSATRARPRVVHEA